MDKDLISILLPVFNGERFLKSAIDSVLFQTYTNFELLIYNDGSTDKTIEIIKTFNDKRIKLFNSEKNDGIVYTLNFLIDKSVGNYIARIDADDIWYSTKLEKQIRYLKEYPENYFVACFAKLIDDKGLDFPTKFKQFSDTEKIKKCLPNSNFIIHSSVIIRRKMFNEVGKYRDKYLHTEDYDLWLRVLEKNLPFTIIGEVLLNYRVSRYSVNFRFRKLQSKNVIRLKLNYWRKNGFKFFYLFELRKNFYYRFFPYWILAIKRKIFNKHQS